MRFCENCGAVLQQQTQPPPQILPAGRFCPNCGTPNPRETNFCKSCGFSFSGYAPLQNTYYPPQPRQSNSLNLLYILEAIGGLVLIVAVLFGIYLFMSGRLSLPISPQVVIVTQPPIIQPAAPPQPIVVTATLPPQPIVVTATNPPQPVVNTASYTNTPTSPKFTATQDALCRAGPSKDFSQKAGIIAGQSATIIGRSEAKWGDWWQVNYKGVKCWVWSDLGNASGNLNSVQVVEVEKPQTPTGVAPEPHYILLINQTDATVCQIDFKSTDGKWRSYNVTLVKNDKQSLAVTPGLNTIIVYFSSHANPCGFVVDKYYDVNIDPFTVGVITIYNEKIDLD